MKSKQRKCKSQMRAASLRGDDVAIGVETTKSLHMSVSDSWRGRRAQNSGVNLALRAGLISSNPETLRADVPQQLAAKYCRGVKRWRGDRIVTYRGGRESVHLIHELKGC